MSDETVVDFRGRGGGGGPERERVIPDCPVLPLGHNSGRYYYLSGSGERLVLHFRELSAPSGQIALFNGDMAYPCAEWPRLDRDGAVIKNDWNPKKAAAGLIAMCVKVGMYDPETPIHGRGVWRVENDRLIGHFGNQLLFSDGGIAGAGMKIGGAIYSARPPLEPPAAEPLPASAAKEFRRDFTFWRVRPMGLGGINSDLGPDGLAGDLLFAATCLAMLGAAPRWRVHTLVKAVHGAGKSTLLSFIAGALGPSAIVMNNFSEAGLRRSLEGEARPVFLDEAEGDEQGVMSQAIRLIRQMSGGQGVKGTRGTGDGGAQFFEIAGCAFLFCINMPVLMPQDLSRILVLDMLPAIPAHERQAYDAIARAERLSPGLRARAFYGWDRFRQNLVWLRAALVHRGCSGRQADQLGGLLAASAMMLEDQPIDQGHADDLAEALDPLIEAMKAEEADNSDALRCWRTLITTRCNVWRSGEAQTVGSILVDARADGGTEARKVLNFQCGMRLEAGDRGGSMPETPCLYVSNQHGFLKEAFRDTPWRDGGWAHSLTRLTGASSSRSAIKIGGSTQRATAVPLRHLPRPDRPGDEEEASDS